MVRFAVAVCKGSLVISCLSLSVTLLVSSLFACIADFSSALLGLGFFSFAELPSRLLLLRSASFLVLLLVFVLDFSGGFLSFMCSQAHQRSLLSLHFSVYLALVAVCSDAEEEYFSFCARRSLTELLMVVFGNLV